MFCRSIRTAGANPKARAVRTTRPAVNPEEPFVHADLGEARHVGRHECHQQVEGVGGRHEPADAAEGRDDHALGQELAQQASGAAAHRGADRELLLAPRVAGQHQVRDVDAGDQQHEDDGAPEQQQHRAHCLDLARLQGDDARADASVWCADSRRQAGPRPRPSRPGPPRA